jgi:hypothetical protein
MAENGEKELVLTVSQPQVGILRLQLTDQAGSEMASEDLPHTGHVDKLLLTGVDNLLKRSKLHESALRLVVVGQGIDKNSSLYRIVQSFAAAVTAS